MTTGRPARLSSLPPDSFPEKRTFRRYSLWFPVTLTVVTTPPDSSEVWAICRDASAGGMQLSSSSPLEIGTKVAARFRVTPRAEERFVDAEIVRSETNDGELMLAFPFRLGLRFVRPVPELPEELANQLGVEP